MMMLFEDVSLKSLNKHRKKWCKCVRF